jgi:hypothetical protein
LCHSFQLSVPRFRLETKRMNLLEVSLRPKDNEEKDGATIRHVVVVLLSKVI